MVEFYSLNNFAVCVAFKRLKNWQKCKFEQLECASTGRCEWRLTPTETDCYCSDPPLGPHYHQLLASWYYQHGWMSCCCYETLEFLL